MYCPKCEQEMERGWCDRCESGGADVRGGKRLLYTQEDVAQDQPGIECEVLGVYEGLLALYAPRTGMRWWVPVERIVEIVDIDEGE